MDGHGSLKSVTDR